MATEGSNQNAAPGPAKAAETVTTSAGTERPDISPEQFLAEMEAAAAEKTPPAAAGEAEATTDEKKPEGEADEAKTAADGDAEKSDEKAEGQSDEAAAAKPEGEDDKAGEAKTDDTPDIKAARKIYQAAARKEAQALGVQRQNKALADKVERIEKLLSGAPDDPVAALQILGFGRGSEKDPIKDLLARVVAKGEPKDPTPEDRIAQLEAKLAERDAKGEEQKQLDLIERHQNAVTEAVRAGGDKFDLVNAFDAHDQVWAVMVEYHAKHGVALDPLVAAEHVEKHLQGRIAKSNKFKAPAGASAAANAAAKPATTSNGKPPASNAKGKSETLTNTEPGQTPIRAEDLPLNDHDARFGAVAKEFGFSAIH